jgi:DNA-binding protein YbaB
MDLSALARNLGPVQDAMRSAQAERETAVLVGKAGGGAVTISLTGMLTVKEVRLAKGAAAGDESLLEDLIAAALSDALRQHRERYGATPDEQMQRVFQRLDPMAMMRMLGG